MGARGWFGIGLAIAAFIGGAPAAGADDATGKVIGGTFEPTGPLPIPIVALAVPGTPVADTSFCAGTVIGDRTVLTAAHCIVGPFVVHYGTTNLRDAGQTRTPVDVLTHQTIDVAVVELEAPFDGVTPMRFAVPGVDVIHGPGSAVRVWGWGASSSQPGGPADRFDPRLQSAAMTVHATRVCDDIYTAALTTELCAGPAAPGSPRLGPCPGDSGGPVTAPVSTPGGGTEVVLVGVVSSGAEDCGSYPSFNAPVYQIGFDLEAFTARSVAPYADIAGNPLRPGIEAVTATGVVGGFPDGLFRPDQPVSRGQLATFVTRAVDIEAPTTRAFPDIAESPHRAAIELLAGAGILAGFTDGTFRPNDPVSRAQLATYLNRAAAFPLANVDGTIPDVDPAGPHATSIYTAVRAGILDVGPDGRFDPSNQPSRAAMSDAIARLLFLAAYG